MIVVDASAVLEILLRTPVGLAHEERLLSGPDRWNAPGLIDLEIANTLARHERNGVLTRSDAAAVLDAWLRAPIRRWNEDGFLPRIWALRHSVTAYDAAYVALTEMLEATLITADTRLGRAIDHQIRMEVWR